jgi:hypothetical protein
MRDSEALRGNAELPALGYLGAIEDSSADFTLAERVMIHGLHFLSVCESRDPLIVAKSSSDEQIRKRTDVDSIASSACTFCNHYGRLPTDGAELFLFENPSANSLSAWAEVRSGNERKVLDSLGYRINPATGRFHDRFDSPKWSPGGIYIRKATEAEFREQNAEKAQVFRELKEPLPPAYIIQYFGERPESVIWSEFLMTIPEPSETGYFDHKDVSLPGHLPAEAEEH